MKVFKTSELDIQLYQITPNEGVLSVDAVEIRDTILESDQLNEHKEARVALKSAVSIGDIIEALAIIKDQNYRARRITSVFNRFLGSSDGIKGVSWDQFHRGVRISDERVIKEGQFRDIRTVMIAQLRFDRIKHGKPVFTVVVRNPLYFSRNLKVVDFIDFLYERRMLYLPAYDRQKNFNNILRNVEKREVFHYESKTRKNPSPKRIGERFVASGRMTEQEYEALTESETLFPICYSTPYSDYKKRYCYPARDIEIVASDGLLKLQNDNPILEFPQELGEAIALYRFAKTDILAQMVARSDLVGQLSALLGTCFDMAPTVRAECNHLQTPRYRLKGRTKVNRAVREGEAFYTEGVSQLGINALCYPFAESTPEREEKFLSFFSPNSKAGDFGFEFEHVRFSAKMAVKDPVRTAERIVNESGGCNAALVAWPNWSNLPNNKMLEFELMRRGVAVQNVVNQNFKLDAPKISALIKGMAEKFPIADVQKGDSETSISPFHYAIGLDISRHGNLDIASFPIVIDQQGRVSCTFSETPYTKDKEKRSTGEILKVIYNVLEAAGHTPEEKVNLLFLRDGVAFEDYQQISEELPRNVTLTVVSVRKNLLNVCSVDMPEGCFYSIYSQHDDDRFVFGINARQGDEAKVTRLHLAKAVLNPLGVDMKLLGNILINLACQNKTTEVEILSLPFPIAYADRMAWTIRDMLQDSKLCKHVSDTYPEEVDSAGGATLFIYQEVKRFVESRANGYSFAI